MTSLIKEFREFPISQARDLVKNLYHPRPWIYWSDFLFSAGLGWGAFIITFRVPQFSLEYGASFSIAVLALYRAALFIHEIAHFKKGSFEIFQKVWNLICGYPLMIPTFLYQSVHFDHHKQNFYGTKKDGEYFPFASKGRGFIVLHIFFSFLIPLIFFFRFVVLTPLSYLHSGLRGFVIQKISSLNIDLNYQRPKPSLAQTKGWRIQEFLACIYGSSFMGLINFDIFPAQALFMWYCLVASVFLVNSIRTLAAHRYINADEDELSFTDQMLDSINNPGNRWITPLWAPVGLRFHATHHLFPDLPYHALGKAHKRLLENLGQNSLYGQTIYSGLWSAIFQLWKHASK
ncbi:MAG: fatty acid desaturase [Nitrospinota bacterium]|nr:fatty acid desaturase [Nitrospinota bacterium]